VKLKDLKFLKQKMQDLKSFLTLCRRNTKCLKLLLFIFAMPYFNDIFEARKKIREWIKKYNRRMLYGGLEYKIIKYL